MKKLALVLSLFIATSANAAEFKVKSPNVQDGKFMPKAQEYSGNDCTGQNIFPELEWENAPKNTRSFVVTMFDPDARGGKGWWHFSAYNIPAGASKIESGDGKQLILPEGGKLNRTDFGYLGFGGACPPKGSGTHHYIFTVYALDAASVDANKDTHVIRLLQVIQPNIIAKATITPLYRR